MHFIFKTRYEQDIALFEIGQECGEIAGLGDHGSGGRAKTDAEFARRWRWHWSPLPGC